MPMHAMVAIFRTDPARHEEGLPFLRERIVPTVSRQPGFVAAYWTHDGEG